MNLLHRMGRLALLLIISCFVFVSCKKDEETRSNAKSILKFSVDTISATIDESAHTVKLTVPYALDLTAVKPVITISPEATISPVPGATVNLSSPVTYKVKAADGSEQAYTVTATKKSSNSIESFVVTSGETIMAVINETTHTITITGSFLNNNWVDCKPVIKLSAGATVSPASEEQVNLHHVSKYSVTGANGNVQEYAVKLLNTDNTVLSLQVSLPSVDIYSKDPYLYVRTGAVNRQEIFIAQHLEGISTPYAGIFYATTSDDLSSITFKSVKLPDGATASPSFDLPQNFNKDVVYTITSMAGTTSQITIRGIKQHISTWTAGVPLSYGGWTGVDQIQTLYRLTTSTELDYFWLVDKSGVQYLASVVSDQVNDNGVHNSYIKSNKVLPPGDYHLMASFKDGSFITDGVFYNKP